MKTPPRVDSPQTMSSVSARVALRRVRLLLLLACVLPALTLLAALLPVGGTRVSADALAAPPGWRQSNVSGFTNLSNTMVSALGVLDGWLYATTWNEAGAQVWRTSDGMTWSDFTPPVPFSTTEIYDAKSFGGHLYITTRSLDGGEVWRTDGTTWELASAHGINRDHNIWVNALAVYSNSLYVAASNLLDGIQILRSTTGVSGTWTQVNSDGFGGGATWSDTVMDVYNGYLYVGFSRAGPTFGSTAELWRSQNGTTWTPVFTDALGYPNNTNVSALAEYNGAFYTGLRNSTTGGQVWRTTNGITFTIVTTNGFNTKSNARPYGLIVYDGALYAVLSNYGSGAQVWRGDTSGTWTRVMQGGFGDANNYNAAYFDKNVAEFKGMLYIGTENEATGGQIWQMLRSVFLPLVLR